MKHLNLLLLACMLVSIAGLGQPASPASAATTITVSNLNDDTTSGNGCSLREAMANANNNAATHPDCLAGSGVDTIVFQSALNGSILLGTPLPAISDVNGLSITGGTSKISIIANGVSRAFEVQAGATATLQNLTIMNGSGNGGNIYNAGTLNLISVTVRNGNGTNGGALYNAGGTINVTNSTFTGNIADLGAVFYNNGGTAAFTNVTINDNDVNLGGSGIIYNNGVLTVKNSLFADGNSTVHCVGNALNFTSTNNIADDLSCGPSFAAWSTASIALGPLANYGGSTETFKLLPESVAINAGDNTYCAVTDQRGTGRPQGTLCDAGSYEAKISLTVSPTSLAFGNSVVGLTSLPKTVTVTNTGEANLLPGIITVTGDFAINTDLCSSTIVPPAGTCTFNVVFHPTSSVAKTGTVSIPTNALVSPTNIPVTGTGIVGVNLVVNPGFEKPLKRPMGWRNLTYPYTLTSVMDCSVGLASFCSLKLPGKDKLAYVVQEVRSAGKENTRYLIKLSSKADNISLPPDGVYKGEVYFLDGYGKLIESVSLNFTPGTHDWEQLQTIFVTSHRFFTMNFRILLKSTTGEAWFDNAVLIRLP